MSKIVQFPARERGDEFTAKKLQWIEHVALDASIPAEATRLAVLLAVKFVNRRSGSAFPSQQTLADLLGVTERQVRRLLTALVEAGHVVQSRRGRNRSNEYRVAFGTGRVASGQSERDRTSGGGGTGHLASGPGPDISRPPNPMREPIEEPYEGRPTAGEPSDGCSTVDGSRGSRLEGAPNSPPQESPPVFRVGQWRTNPNGERYEVIAVDVDLHAVTVRFLNGREGRTRAPEGAVLLTDDLDDSF